MANNHFPRSAYLPQFLVVAGLTILASVAGCTGQTSSSRSAFTAVPAGDSYAGGSNTTTVPAAAAAATAVAAPAAEPAAEEPALANDEAQTAARPASTEIDPLDWTYWRGPSYNGKSAETGLIDNFDPDGGEGSNVKWKRDDVGGRSTPIVMHGRIYTIIRAEPGTSREGEKVVCLDAQTGETIWENRFNVWLSDVPDTRVGWSSVVGDPTTDRVYALGVCGYFQCIEAATGETLWSVPMHEKFGLLSTYGGRTNFPIVVDDLVIVSAVMIGWGEKAKPAHQFIGFDKATGDVVWFNGTSQLPDDTTYSAPALAMLNGQKAIVFGSGDGGVWAFKPRTGQPIWQYQFSMRGLNVSPIVVGDRVFNGHSEENIGGSTAMGAVVALDGSLQGNITKNGEIWKVEELMVGKTSPIEHEGRLYCFDDRAKLHILDAATGETVAPRKALGTVMRASPLFADGKFYCATENGRWYVLQPDEKQGVTILNRGRFSSGEECHATPICSHGNVYFQTTTALYCLHDPNKSAGVGEISSLPAEQPVGESEQPAYLQLTPAELLTMPGRIQNFTVRLFNDRGQFIRVAEAGEAQLSLEGPGQISDDGTFLAPGDAQHTATIVTAKVGELSGQARIRVVPPLPWSFDFDELNDAPVTWVGARYRHVIREIDGNKVMVKITTIPKGTRSRCWFGHPELANYTIQADVLGKIAVGKRPDIGLIAMGYTFDLKGVSDELEIRTWDAQLRMARSVDFAWKEDTWYTMKFRSEVVEDADESGQTTRKAVLKGKVWPRGEEEPQQWMIEAVDEAPNLQGSPGLYGNAKDAELFLDNIRVFENESA